MCHKYVVTYVSQICGHIFVKPAKLRIYTTDGQARNIGISLHVTMHITTLRKTTDFFIQVRNQGPFINGG